MSNRRVLGRNDRCWCGSGVKYKKCHLQRERQQPDNPFEAFKKTVAFNRKRLCLHPDAPAGCSKKIIRAHTVQRRTSLHRIAEDGHVLGLSTEPKVLDRTQGKIGVRPIGINRASTFEGFCSYHDNITFSPVEDAPFTATDQQCFLLGYRAMCRELYQKQTVLDAMEYVKTLDRGRSVPEQVYWQQFVQSLVRGHSAGYCDLVALKHEFDRILLSKTFSDVFYYVFFISGVPDVMATFGLTVQYDFEGNRLQVLSDVDTPLDALYVSIIATEPGGAIVLTWRDLHTNAVTKFVESLAVIDNCDVPDAIVRLVFGHSENTFFRPAWWNSLPNDLQSALIDRITTRVDQFTPTAPTYLRRDGNHYVDWEITGRQTNSQV